MTKTWPVLPSFEKDSTKVIFTVNQIARGLSDAAGGSGDVAAMREALTANRSYFVRAAGSDSTGDGLTAGTAFASIQKAWDTIVTLDLRGFEATIDVGPTTFTAGLTAVIAPIGGSVRIDGVPGSTIISTTNINAIYNSSPCVLTVQDVELRTTTAGNCISADLYGFINIGPNIKFGACAGTHIAAASNAVIQINADYAITAGAITHYFAIAEGTIANFSAHTVTITGTPNFSTAFAYAASLGNLYIPSITYSGGTTGLKYSVSVNAVITTNGGVLPGVGTSVTTGGQFV